MDLANQFFNYRFNLKINLKRNYKVTQYHNKPISQTIMKKFYTFKINHLPLILFSLLLLTSFTYSQSDDFQIHDTNQYIQGEQQYYSSQDATQQGDESRQPTQQQMQFFSQRRTACLVLSRYYLNQYSQSINDLIKNLEMTHKNLFINKLYATAVEKCQPLITEMEVVQFYTPKNDQFDPSTMFHIFDGFNFYELGNDQSELTPNQKAITKFIKEFDAEMEVKKEEEQAKKIQEERDQGIQVFFISMKNLSPQAKYLYILLVVAISGVILWYGFSQIGQKPVKKDKKKAKKQQ